MLLRTSSQDGREETWRELWSREMRERRWLWIVNLMLVCAAAGQLLGSL